MKNLEPRFRGQEKMVCRNVCEDYRAKKPVGGMRYLNARNAAKTVTFSFTGRVLDVHAARQNFELVQDEKDSKN